MSVVAITDDYKPETRDKVENFHGNQIVYLHWEGHLMFCSAIAFPLPPDMPFAGVVEQIMPEYYGMHPDFETIDWNKVEWRIDDRVVKPDMAKSLADNGVGHKSLIRFWTPGLDGYKGSGT